jgi:cysteine-rich CPXCG protein
MERDDEATVVCPYCGEPNVIGLDPAGGKAQDYVEDCQVCCQPWRVRVRYGRGGRVEVTAETADGS